MQAKDIDAERLLALIRECNEGRCNYVEIREPGWHGGRPGYGWKPHEEAEPHWANRFDLAKKLGMPDKVLIAKCKRLIERGELHGCACGCRGDFIVPWTYPSIEALRARLLN